MSSKNLTTTLTFRMTPEERDLIDKVAAQIPAVSKNTVVRVALKIGLELLRKDPNLVLSTLSATKRR